MSVISTTPATERLSSRLQLAGINQWIAMSSGDSWGKYLRFDVGGKCIAGCGWSIREAEEIVRQVIALHNELEDTLTIK